MIKGIRVKLHTRVENGADAFNRPTYTDSTVYVDNVLVGEPSTSEIIENKDLYGKRLAYTLAIPKGDTNEWENTTVEFFGEKFRTFGDVIQGIEENIPLSWNKKIMVERFE